MYNVPATYLINLKDARINDPPEALLWCEGTEAGLEGDCGVGVASSLAPPSVNKRKRLLYKLSSLNFLKPESSKFCII